MNNTEINTFIEEMEEIGDVWTEEEAKRVYGNSSLEDALNDRKALVNMQMNNIANVINSRR